jgi:hypothetical protein
MHAEKPWRLSYVWRGSLEDALFVGDIILTKEEISKGVPLTGTLT